MARALAFLPVIRDIFAEAPPTVEGRERVMQQLNRRIHEHPRYHRLPQRAQMFLARYIHRCLEERYEIDSRAAMAPTAPTPGR
jgi:chorismate mutase